MSKVYFDRDNLPPLGSRVQFTRWNPQTHRDEEQQMFYLASARQHVTKKGVESAVLYWDTDCEECGEQFTFSSGLSTGAMYRRCPPCRPLLKREGGWPTGPRMKHVLLDPEPGYEPPVVVEEAALTREEKRALRKARSVSTDEDAERWPLYAALKARDSLGAAMMASDIRREPGCSALARNDLLDMVERRLRDGDIDPASLF
jgi:hypothetical protein